ncbi:demethoxyubiquinone hydroxylase family protein [Sphingomicrobium flavum]|uniref:demethoxyubiquinone hydroxylase family protein n=1 Tax=Sphingomicrobium flavum TaxID=1229164 RepID=UPI0035E3DEA3
MMLRPAKSIAEKMIKVDHTGENGAVNIYRAQAIGARLFARDLLPAIRENREHEERHREIFSAVLQDKGVRRCVSFHLAGVGGFALGFVTGLMGRQAIHATTFAVEHVVLEHLEGQLAYLRDTDATAFRAVGAIVAEEQEHHDHAEANLDERKLLNRALIAIVRLCTEGVIRFGMR